MMKKKGFTTLEIILTLAILAILFAMIPLYYQTSQVRADLNTQASMLVSNLRLLQSNATSGNTGGANAIHLEDTVYTNFSGSSYAGNDPTNFSTDLPPTIIIEDINLNGGGEDVVFSSPDGHTDNFGSFSLRSEQINKTITINISQIGSINY